MFEDLYLYLCPAETLCFDNEGDGEGDPDNSDLGDGDGDRTFNQDEVNKIVEDRLARDRKTRDEQGRKMETQLKEVLKAKDLTESDRTRLQESLDNLQKQLRTKEEDAKSNQKKLQEQYESQLKESRETAQTWESRFKDSSISRALQDAAVANGVYTPSQVVDLLKPRTEISPRIDEESGKETGEFEVLIDFPDKDEDGKSLITRRTPEEALKRMKELEEHANLFKNNVVSGVGANSATGGMSPGSNGRIDVRRLTPEQYKKIRKEKPELLGL